MGEVVLEQLCVSVLCQTRSISDHQLPPIKHQKISIRSLATP